MSYTDATDQVLAVLDNFKIAAFENDEQYEALANAIRKAIAMHVRPGMTDPLQDPGVQGLAQLGRNAIERVAQLEAETARLTGCLERANAQAEHFEREWYLRGEVLDTAEYWLGSLLAVIHRDGGHYEAEHGTARAADDAIAAVHVLRGSLEGYIEANRYMKGELDDAMEDARKYAEAKGEIARLRHEVATLCGYDSADEMDAATGRRK
jgi:hypothetical protein